MSESEAAPEPETAETPENDPEPQVEEDDSESLPTGAVLARVAGDQLYRLSMVAQLGVIVAGGSLVLVAAGTGEGAAGSLKTLLAIALAVVSSLVVGQTLRGFGALLHVQADSADATGRIEQRISDSLERLERTLEALAEAPRGVPAPSSRVDPAAEIRQAIRNGRWEDAQSLLGSLSDERPDDPDVARLAEELASARHAAAQELLAKVEAAREVNDPDRVIELRDALKPLLDPDALRALDRDLARWFLLLIQKRLRTGTVRPDVAVLAGRVADSLDDTPEGASLRASLPTLRRAAGLCARCAQPYVGVAAACPSCLAAAVAATAHVNAAPPPVPTRPAEPVPQPEPEPDPDEIVPPRQDDLEYFEPERS